MINHVNKNIDIRALEERLSEEIEEKLEFGCYTYAGPCDSYCGLNRPRTCIPYVPC